jgi:hypothetical protein
MTNAEPLMHLLLGPDKPILAGFLGSFASYPLSVLTGPHDYADFICLARQPVNNPHPAMKAESGVSKNGGILSVNKNPSNQIF